MKADRFKEICKRHDELPSAYWNAAHQDREWLIKRIEELEADIEHYQTYEVMIVGATAQAQEYGDGTVGSESLLKFREMLQQTLENKEQMK